MAKLLSRHISLPQQLVLHFSLPSYHRLQPAHPSVQLHGPGQLLSNRLFGLLGHTGQRLAAAAAKRVQLEPVQVADSDAVVVANVVGRAVAVEARCGQESGQVWDH